jgi:predicted CXXCH cytochrome family protein
MHLGKKYIFFLLLAALLSFLIGCSPKVVSFFFDGVPNPGDSLHIALDTLNHSDTIPGKDIAGIAPTSSMQYHPPYKNRKCNLCHDPSSGGKLIQKQPALCYNCHDGFNTIYLNVHGPVDLGACSACHAPHMSENKNLILRTGQDLCFYCHDSRDISRNGKHKITENTDCQECHNPHGSNKKFLLK